MLAKSASGSGPYSEVVMPEHVISAVGSVLSRPYRIVGFRSCGIGEGPERGLGSTPATLMPHRLLGGFR